MKTHDWAASRIHSLILVCLSLCALQALAQTRQDLIDQIHAEGPSRFSGSQISLASGLKAGQPADDPILSAAANRLAQTGAFSEVSYRYTTLNGKMTVTFHVVDATKTLSATYDNFVWFAPDEVDRAVRAEVPLYDGRVPTDGDLARAVATALEHLLAQHHIAASVAYLPAAKAIGTPPTEFRYSAKGNLPVVTSVELTGGPLDPSLFAVAKQRLMGRPFSSAYARSLAENDLDVIYQNHAYLQAHFDDPKVTFLPGANESDPSNVKLVFTVAPGHQYSWHVAEWGGNTAYSSADLDRAFAMKEGDPAAADKISEGMDAVRGAYGTKGYIAFRLSFRRTFDDAANQVHYSFQLDEGSQYRMGLFTVSGFDEKTAEQIHKAWRLKSGDIYDSSYMKEFVRKDLPGALARNSSAIAMERTSISTRANPDNLTVNVDVSVKGK